MSIPADDRGFQAFAEGFRRRYGREPTRQEYQAAAEAAQTANDPRSASTGRTIAAMVAPTVGGIGGYALYNELIRGGAETAATQGVNAGTTAATAPSAPQLIDATRTGATAAGAQTGGAVASQGVTSAAPAAPQLLSATRTGATTGANAGASAAGNIAQGALGTAAAGYGLYQLYQLGKDAEYKGQYGRRALAGAGAGAAVGAGATAAAAAAYGSSFGPWGTVIGAALGGLYGLGAAHTGSGKDARQVYRDKIRSRMQELGLVDEEYQILGNDIGQDGGFRFDDGRRIYETYAGQEDGTGEISDYHRDLIGNTQAAGYLIGGGDEDAAGYATGMITNAIQGDDRDDLGELRELYDKMGGKDALIAAIGEAMNNEDLDWDTGLAYQNAINNVYRDDYQMAPITPEEAMAEGLMSGGPQQPVEITGPAATQEQLEEVGVRPTTTPELKPNPSADVMIDPAIRDTALVMGREQDEPYMDNGQPLINEEALRRVRGIYGV